MLHHCSFQGTTNVKQCGVRRSKSERGLKYGKVKDARHLFQGYKLKQDPFWSHLGVHDKTPLFLEVSFRGQITLVMSHTQIGLVNTDLIQIFR